MPPKLVQRIIPGKELKGEGFIRGYAPARLREEHELGDIISWSLFSVDAYLIHTDNRDVDYLVDSLVPGPTIPQSLIEIDARLPYNPDGTISDFYMARCKKFMRNMVDRLIRVGLNFRLRDQDGASHFVLDFTEIEPGRIVDLESINSGKFLEEPKYEYRIFQPTIHFLYRK